MLQWESDQKVLQIQRGGVIAVILPQLGKNEWLWTALRAATKYCRVLWRMVKGAKRWYVQLVQTGLVPVKASVLTHRAPEGSVGGFDLGTASAGWCTHTEAGLEKLCPEIDDQQAAIRILQRQIGRQRRANAVMAG